MRRLVAALALGVAFVPAAVAAADVTYNGRWEVVRADDRGHERQSVRSFHPWDSLNFIADGESLRIYGITGPTGGRAVVAVAGLADTVVDFFSPRKRAHVLIYQSPPLSPGPHSVALIVTASKNVRSHGTYVNVDQIAIQRPVRPGPAPVMQLPIFR